MDAARVESSACCAGLLAAGRRGATPPSDAAPCCTHVLHACGWPRHLSAGARPLKSPRGRAFGPRGAEFDFGLRDVKPRAAAAGGSTKRKRPAEPGGGGGAGGEPDGSGGEGADGAEEAAEPNGVESTGTAACPRPRCSLLPTCAAYLCCPLVLPACAAYLCFARTRSTAIEVCLQRVARPVTLTEGGALVLDLGPTAQTFPRSAGGGASVLFAMLGVGADTSIRERVHKARPLLR